MKEQVRQAVEDVYRTQSRHVLATLIRLLGDFDLTGELRASEARLREQVQKQS